MTETPDASEGDDTALQAWEVRHRAHMHEVGVKAGFDDAPDHAALIVRVLETVKDRYSRDRSHPIIGPLVQRCSERYGEIRMHDFSFANRVATTEVVRAVLALSAQEVAEALDATPEPLQPGP